MYAVMEDDVKVIAEFESFEKASRYIESISKVLKSDYEYSIVKRFEVER